MRYLTLLFLTLTMPYVFCVTSNSMTLDKSYTTSEKITLSGTLKTKQFLDADDQPEDTYILNLKDPISVSKDETGGPENNVSQIQLAILYKQYKKADSCIDKNVVVNGYLYYPFNAHHHTPVLLRVLTFSCSRSTGVKGS